MRRAEMATSLAAAAGEESVELLGDTDLQVAGFRGRGVPSLHPDDFQDLAEYAQTVFSRTRSSHFNQVFQRSEPSLGALSQLNELYFSNSVGQSDHLQPQVLHVLNLAFVKTVRDFAAMARARVEVHEEPGEPNLEAETARVHVHHGSIISSSSTPEPAANQASLWIHFINERDEVIHRYSLNGQNLFSLGKGVADNLEFRWRDQLQANITSVGAALAREIAASLGERDPQLRLAIEENATTLGKTFLQLLDGTPEMSRLVAAGKEYMPTTALYGAMKAYNETLDREAISIALRFGTMRSFTHATYVACRDPKLRAALAASPYQGSWALLALPPALFGRVNGLSPKTAGVLQEVLRHMHDGLQPSMRDRIGQESAQYLMGFRTRGGVHTTNATGKPMAMSFDSLPSLIEAGLINPAEAGAVLAGAMNRVAQELGGAEKIRRLPPPRTLMTSRPLMEMLANATTGIIPLSTEPLLMSMETRIKAGSFILLDALHGGKNAHDAEGGPAGDDFSIKTSDFTSAPSFQALLTYRGSDQHADISARAMGSALRSMMGAQHSAKEPLATRIERPSSMVRANMEWSLAQIRRVDDFNFSALPYAKPGVEGGAEGATSADDVALGTRYQLTFVSNTTPQHWISMTVAAAVSPAGTLSSTVPGLKMFGQPDTGVITGPGVTPGDPELQSVQVLAMPPFDPTHGDDSSPTFNALVTRKALGRGAMGRLQKDVLYRGLPGSGDLYMPWEDRKLGEASRKALGRHADALGDLVRQRLAAAARRDPLLFAATLGSGGLDLTEQLQALHKPGLRLATDSSMRAALVASGTGASVALRRAAAHTRDPFKITRGGASLLDLAEWAQTPSRLGLNEFSRPAANDMVRQALAGLCDNPMAAKDQARLSALLQRSADNCLHKVPELLPAFLSAGLPPSKQLFELLEQMHPNQVGEEVRREWQEMRMRLQIGEVTVGSTAGQSPSAGSRPHRRGGI